MQAAERSWPARAVHDSVQAVLRDPAFRRSLRRSIADRLLIWIAELFERLGRLARELPSMRSVVFALLALAVVFIVVRAVMSAAAERDGVRQAAGRRHGGATDDPWHDADLLAAAGRFEDAAHALYRGVLSSVARAERLRLDPSKTSGDYARELRRRGSAALAPFRAFTRRFDVAVYGHGGCDARSVGELRLLAQPFEPRRRAA